MMTRTTPSVSDAFKSILQTVNNIKKITHPGPGYEAPTSSSPTVSSLISLPDPPALYPQLIARGLAPCLAEKVSQSYLTRAAQLRQRAEVNVSGACSAIAELPRQANLMPVHTLQNNLVLTYRNIYMNTLHSWIKEALDLVNPVVTPKRGRDMTTSSLPTYKRARGPTFNQVRVSNILARGLC
jgi:hypothetical protein